MSKPEMSNNKPLAFHSMHQCKAFRINSLHQRKAFRINSMHQYNFIAATRGIPFFSSAELVY